MMDERHACNELARDVRHFLGLEYAHEPVAKSLDDAESPICNECLQPWPCNTEELRKSMEKYDAFMENK